MYNNTNLDNIFKALSNHHRRKILLFLQNTPMTTGYLCQLFDDLDRCSVMKHLKVLEKADLIEIRRVGRERWNYINTTLINSDGLKWLTQFKEEK